MSIADFFVLIVTLVLSYMQLGLRRLDAAYLLLTSAHPLLLRDTLALFHGIDIMITAAANLLDVPESRFDRISI